MGSTGKSTNYGTITKPNGTVVQLPAKLVYSEDTGSMKIPQNVLDFEKKYKNAKIEHLILQNDWYGEIGRYKGKEGKVNAPKSAHLMADLSSHNHPRTGDQEGWLSGTFSPQDIDVFAGYHTTDRVVGYEGIYSISKGNNFDNSIVSDYAKFADNLRDTNNKIITQWSKDCDNEHNALERKFKADNKGKSFDEFEKAYNKFADDWKAINNKYLNKANDLANKSAIDMHDWLLANQKKYGYTYGLTRG